MCKNEKPRSSSHERLIKGYLSPQLNSKLPALIDITGSRSQSEIVNRGVRLLMEQHKLIPPKNKT